MPISEHSVGQSEAEEPYKMRPAPYPLSIIPYKTEIKQKRSFKECYLATKVEATEHLQSRSKPGHYVLPIYDYTRKVVSTACSALDRARDSDDMIHKVTREMTGHGCWVNWSQKIDYELQGTKNGVSVVHLEDSFLKENSYNPIYGERMRVHKTNHGHFYCQVEASTKGKLGIETREWRAIRFVDECYNQGDGSFEVPKWVKESDEGFRRAQKSNTMEIPF